MLIKFLTLLSDVQSGEYKRYQNRFQLCCMDTDGRLRYLWT